MKISLFHLLLAIAICAVVVAWRHELGNFQPDPDGPLPFLLFLLASVVVLTLLVAATQRTLARLTTAHCYRFGLLPALRLVAGRRLVALELNRLGMKCGDTDNRLAIDIISAALRINPSEAAYWVNRGVFNYRAGEFDAAISDLSHGIEIAPAVKDAHGHRGYAYFAKGMFQLAIDDLSLHSCVSSSDAQLAFYRGAAYEQLFAWKRAAEEYQLACRLDNSLTDAVVAFARLQACCPDATHRDGEKAVENARRICTLTEWKDWTSISVLAAAHAEVGDFQSAIRFARQAAEVAPDTEQQTRLARIQAYEQGVPFRLPDRDCVSRTT